MACSSCGTSILNIVGAGLQKLSQSFTQSAENTQVFPNQTLSGGDANVYGNPTSLASGNGTNANKSTSQSQIT